MAMPGAAPTPVRRSIRLAPPSARAFPSRIDPFAETGADQLDQRRQRRLGIVSLADETHGHTVGRHQRQQAHDALAVGLRVVLHDLHLAAILVRELDELHRRAGMHAEAVADLHGTLDRHRTTSWTVVLPVSSAPVRIDRRPTSRSRFAISTGPTRVRSIVVSFMSIGRLTPETTSAGGL